jgi:hypothetical protein
MTNEILKNNDEVSISKIITLTLDIFKNEKSLKRYWAIESLKFATESKDLKIILRSYQIFRSINPILSNKHIFKLLENIKENMTVKYQQSTDNNFIIMIEILKTLKLLIKNVDQRRIILFPQLFWITYSFLYSDFIEIFHFGIEIFLILIDIIDFNHKTVENVLLSTK